MGLTPLRQGRRATTRWVLRQGLERLRFQCRCDPVRRCALPWRGKAHRVATMDGRDITALGYREGPIVGLALRIAKRAIKRMPRAEVDAKLKEILATPEA